MNRLYLLFIIFFYVNEIQGQSSIWSAHSLPFTQDTVSLEDMTMASTVTFSTSSPHATSLLSFPAGFAFQLGLQKYDSFSISNYGYIKLGAEPFTVNPNLQDSVISALYCFPNSFPNVSYKLTGTTPNRKMIIEWKGPLIEGNTAEFQLSLYETNGRIEFVYNTIQTYRFIPYHIFCKASLFGAHTIASVKYTNDQKPAANYSSVEQENTHIIPAKTRFSFQPDTLKPHKPAVSFANVQPGCFDLVVTDESDNESIFAIEIADNSSDYRFPKFQYSQTQGGRGERYLYPQTHLQPDSQYSYRSFASNGFINSDTVYNNIRTPMPLLNGIRKIPGDYPSITALLADAICKHVGPALVIELQNDYSYSLEPAPIKFDRFLQTKVLKSITVRPAAGAFLRLSSSGRAPLFTVDSVKNVEFDGRAGGIGSTIGMTIEQLSGTYPAISYINYADSGTIQYCAIEGASQNNAFGLIYIGPKDDKWGSFLSAVDGTTIRNCKIGPSNGYSGRLLVMEMGNHFLIEENEFFRFKDAAIFYNFGETGTRISKNRFYQPEPVTGMCKAIQCPDLRGDIMMDSNLIGGATSEWGHGRWTSNSPFVAPALLEISGHSSSHTYIKGNKFGNISIAGNDMNLIDVKECAVTVEDNQFGSKDSTNSITSEFYLAILHLSGLQGKKTVIQNTFSGLTSAGDLTMMVSTGVDSLIVKNNDFGGSNRRNANLATGQASAVYLFATRNALIFNNEIRGITSSKRPVFGITQEWGGTSTSEKNMWVDSNRIHHLQGKLTVYGIYARLRSTKKNQFNHNQVYALRAIGPSAAIGASQPNFTGAITIEHYAPGDFNEPEESNVEIAGNKIYSLEYEYEMPEMPYIYSSTGISVSGRNVSIINNMIQLGIAANGQSTDSLELGLTGIAVSPVVKGEIEHNSIYIGGSGENAHGVIFLQDDTYDGPNKFFFTNNIIQIDRIKAGGTADYISYVATANNYKQVSNIVSNNNIWYSQTDPDINQKLAAWRSRSGCDAASFIADPMFINPGGDSGHHDLHIQPESPANGAGTPGVSYMVYDIDGQLRNDYSPVDIGADAITHCAGSLSDVRFSVQSGGANFNICPGTELTLQATSSGDDIIRLQWQKDLQNIESANASTYQAGMAGMYRVVGQTVCGLVASETITISENITPMPSMYLSSPGSSSYCEGDSILLKVGFDSPGQSQPKIKWYKNNLLQPNRNTASEVFHSISVGDQYKAELIFELPCGVITIKDSIKIPVIPSVKAKVELISDETLYRSGSTDSIRYKVKTTSSDNIGASVLLAPPAPGINFRMEGDSLAILENLPPLNIQIRLYTLPNEALVCYQPDTSQVITLHYKPNPDIPEDSGDSADIVLYPNPTRGAVLFQSESVSGRTNVELYNCAGTKIYTTQLFIQQSVPTELRLPTFNSGVYYVKIYGQNKSYTLKLILY